MPAANVRLLGVEYRLRLHPADLNEPEQHHVRVELALGHLMALGRVLEHLSAEPAVGCCGDLPPGDILERIEEFDAGVNTLGLLIACIAGEAWSSLTEMTDSLQPDPRPDAE